MCGIFCVKYTLNTDISFTFIYFIAKVNDKFSDSTCSSDTKYIKTSLWYGYDMFVNSLWIPDSAEFKKDEFKIPYIKYLKCK